MARVTRVVGNLFHRTDGDDEIIPGLLKQSWSGSDVLTSRGLIEHGPRQLAKCLCTYLCTSQHHELTRRAMQLASDC